MPLIRGVSENGPTKWTLTDMGDRGVALHFENNYSGGRTIYHFKYTQSVQELHKLLSKLLIEESRRAAP